MRPLLVFAALLVLTGDVSPAMAQDQAPGQPLFRGLFGGAAPLPGREHVLDLSASAFAGYVETLTETPEDDVPAAWFRGGNGSMSYQRLWTSSSVGAFVTGGASYSDELEEAGESPWVTRWNTGVFGNYSKRLGRRTSMSTGATVAYSPQYRFGLNGISAGGPGQGFGGGGIGGPGNIQSIPGLDYTVADQPTLFSTGTAQLTREITSKSSLEFYYFGNHVTFLDEDPEQNFDDYFSQSGGARYRHAINQWVSARAGYGYSVSRYQDADQQSGNHLIDVGLDGGYGKEFQLARKTTFEFNTRSNVLVHDSIREDDAFDPEARFFVGGTAAIAHRWGRTWQARAEYQRSAGFVDTFADPVTANRVAATLSGLATRRLDLTGRAYYTTGTVGFDDDSYETATATVQTRWALTRNIAAFGQYFYYYYRFDSGITLPGDIDRRLERQGGSVGVTFWLPLL